MNAVSLNHLVNAAKILVLGAIISVIVLISRQSELIAHPAMVNAVIFDLTLSLPFTYWLFIRRTSVSQLTVIPVFIFGLYLASALLPGGNAVLTNIKTFFLPVLEISVLSYAGCLILKSRKAFKVLRIEKLDVLESLREALAAGFPVPAAGRAAAFELAIIYYAFFKWRRKLDENSFTYHRRNGSLTLLAVFIF